MSPPPTPSMRARPAVIPASVSTADNRGRNGRKVLVVAPQPFYTDRGTPIALRQEVEALSQLGYGVDLLTYPIGGAIHVPGLRILRAANPLGIRSVPIGFSWRKVVLDLSLVYALARRLRRERYVCVQALEEMAFPAVMLTPRETTAVLYDMQSSLPEQLAKYPILRGRVAQSLLARCERWLLRRADFVVGSAGLAPHVRESVPDANVREWRFPSELRAVSTDEVDAARLEIGVSADVPIVLYSGNFETYQGIDDLVAAIPLVVAAVPDTVFVLLGGDTFESETTERAAEKLVRSGRLRLVPRQPRDRVAAFLTLADVLVSPRKWGENLPLKIFEYLAAGRPIVATDIPTHRALLDETTALFVAPRAPALADGVVELLQSPGRARRMAAAGRSYARQNLRWDAFVTWVNRLFAEVEASVKFDRARSG